MSDSPKYTLKCLRCGHLVSSMQEWFSIGQKCPACGNTHVEAQYSKPLAELKELIYSDKAEKSLWRYFDFLPLQNRENIVSRGEKTIEVDRWNFLEDFAKKKYGVSCKVYAYRNDDSVGTGSFKDVAGAMAASALKEAGVKHYVVASTGNVANAFAYYCALAGVSLIAFVPQDASEAIVSGVGVYGQRVFRVAGDYAMAKKMAADYAKKYNLVMTGGNTDPLRVEAKRTMVFDWLRIMPEFPTVYIQALSGGTGPIAIDKGLRDIEALNLVKAMPRFILVQPSGCAPMAEAWQAAKAKNFPEGWEKEYPIYENPKTRVSILATGNPGSYPLVAELVKKSKGEIIVFDENQLANVGCLVAYEDFSTIGPAAAVAVGGFFDALKKNQLKDDDVVLISVGENAQRAPWFIEEEATTNVVAAATIDDCPLFDREATREKVWAPFMQ